MSEYENSMETKVADKTVTIFEINVKQIRQWFKDVEERDLNQSDYVDEMLFDDFSISDLTRMSTMKLEDLSELSPSKIRHLAELCKEKNEDFFAMIGKRSKLLDQALGLLDKV